MNGCLVALGMLLLMPYSAYAQRLDGGTIQFYPAGFTASYRSEWAAGDRTSVMGTAGINLTDRHDWGRHDKESGGGGGVGLGMQRWAQHARAGWYWGASLDSWLLSIEWSDDSPVRTGDTTVLVLQPAAKVGYSITWRRSRIDLGAAFGIEINTWKNDENVGEGAILLLGIALIR